MTITAPGRAQKLCESRGGRPGLPVPDKPDGFCGRKAATETDPVQMVVLPRTSTHRS